MLLQCTKLLIHVCIKAAILFKLPVLNVNGGKIVKRNIVYIRTLYMVPKDQIIKRSLNEAYQI